MPCRCPSTGQHQRGGEEDERQDEAGEEVLWRSISELEPLQPSFVSVTYGAGGTTRDRTLAAVVWVEDGEVTVVAGALDTGEVLEVARGLR